MHACVHIPRLTDGKLDTTVDVYFFIGSIFLFHHFRSLSLLSLFPFLSFYHLHSHFYPPTLFTHTHKPALSPAYYLLFSYLCFLSLSHSHSTILTFTHLLIFLYSSYIFLLIFRELEQARTMQLIVLCTMVWTMKASSKFHV